jgi:hypothetical protein
MVEKQIEDVLRMDDQGFGSALIYSGSGYGSGSSIFSNCGSGSRVL